MISPRRLRLLSPAELLRLTRPRLLAYRRTVLSLESSPELSDWSPSQVQSLDGRFMWFKSDPRWQPAYEAVLAALARSTHAA